MATENCIITRTFRGVALFLATRPNLGYAWSTERDKAEKFDSANALEFCRGYNMERYADEGPASVLDPTGAVIKANSASPRNTSAPIPHATTPRLRSQDIRSALASLKARIDEGREWDEALATTRAQWGLTDAEATHLVHAYDHQPTGAKRDAKARGSK